MIYFFLMNKTNDMCTGCGCSGFLVRSVPDMKLEGLHPGKLQLCKCVRVKLDTELLRYPCTVTGREERANLILG